MDFIIAHTDVLYNNRDGKSIYSYTTPSIYITVTMALVRSQIIYDTLTILWAVINAHYSHDTCRFSQISSVCAFMFFSYS